MFNPITLVRFGVFPNLEMMSTPPVMITKLSAGILHQELLSKKLRLTLKRERPERIELLPQVITPILNLPEPLPVTLRAMVMSQLLPMMVLSPSDPVMILVPSRRKFKIPRNGLNVLNIHLMDNILLSDLTILTSTFMMSLLTTTALENVPLTRLPLLASIGATTPNSSDPSVMVMSFCSTLFLIANKILAVLPTPSPLFGSLITASSDGALTESSPKRLPVTISMVSTCLKTNL